MRFVLWTCTDGTEASIPLKHVRLIRKLWAEGKNWQLCSPVFDLSRELIVRIVTMNEKELMSHCR